MSIECFLIEPVSTDSESPDRWRKVAEPEDVRDHQSEFGPGAMWDAFWLDRKGPDGKALVVILPDGHMWQIDGRAKNCGRKNDEVHRCWVRHGEPPMLTVDKNGDTCVAGQGSIQSGGWHGFLRDGKLVVA